MNTTLQTLDLVKQALANPLAANRISKSISTGTGLVAYDLQAPAKNLYPTATPLRNRIPRVGGGTGTATNWKSITALIGSGYNAMPWVPEGQRSARMSYNVQNKAAPYVTIGEEDQATYEAINAGKGFEDVKARMVMRLLQKLMLKEEEALIGGNASVALGTPVAPTVATVATGGTVAAGSYNVKVVALTYEGFRNSSLVSGVATSQTVTGADGQTYTLSGGSSNISAAGAVTTTGSTSVINASVTPVNGAVAYAWFVGTAGAERLNKITSINSAVITAINATSQLATAVTADNSRNANFAFDGLLSNAFAGTGAYVKTMATGTVGAGTGLTSSGRGSVDEIDAMLMDMWTNYQVSPTAIFVNVQELKNITKKVLSSSTVPLLHYYASPEAGAQAIAAGGAIEFYFNPYALGGGYKIPVLVHPTLPPGTILAMAENLPAQYQSSEVPNVAEVKTRADYYQIDWPLRTRAQEVGVYAEETLAVYAPFAMGVITNIADA
ncbi:MAG: hypothetical protein AB1400_08865 [Pseudomonadota bacterium]